MNLTFDPISSPGAKRDLFVDLSGALETDELLTQVTVASAYPAVLTVDNVLVNYEKVKFGDKQVPVGKGVHFSVETVQESHVNLPLLIAFVGSAGTVDNYEISQPVVAALRN